ncbi:MAG TPA: hypothetical protein PKO15_17930 [Fibrobacteria bacterium]|mgnify:CR=1 FL=1|nr:hypothetical protein [Fibrobacteria bacterium]
MIQALLLALLSAPADLSFHPEVEYSGNFPYWGDYGFGDDTWGGNGGEFSEGVSSSFEQTVRGGASVQWPLGETWRMSVGTHIGYSWASAEDGTRGASNGQWKRWRFELDYCLADIQIGLRWKPWRHIGILSDLVLEKGLFGLWKVSDTYGYSERGEIQTSDPWIGTPLKVYLRAGPQFHFLDRYAIAPWLGFGYAPLLTKSSNFGRSTGYYGVDEDKPTLGPKFGIQASLAI